MSLAEQYAKLQATLTETLEAHLKVVLELEFLRAVINRNHVSPPEVGAYRALDLAYDDWVCINCGAKVLSSDAERKTDECLPLVELL